MSTREFVDDFPKIAGVALGAISRRSSRSADGFRADWLQCRGPSSQENITTRPTFIINDAVTWTKSAHTLKVGMEWRKIMGNTHSNGNQAGRFHVRSRIHRDCWRQQRQSYRQLPARRGGQRELDVPRRDHDLPSTERVDLPRRRHLACQRQAHARLRPAVGLLLAIL